MKLPDWWYPELAQTTEGLALLSKALLARLPSGMQQGRRTGPEQEFSQYRHYMPGDDLRWLDWKAYARSRRLYVKEAEVTSSMPVWLVIDCSRSMEHRQGSWSKMAYAKATAAMLSRLILQQQDQLNVLLVQEKKSEAIPFQPIPRFFEKVIHQLAAVKAKGSWPSEISASLKQIKQAFVIVISDFHQDEDELYRSLQAFKRQGNEVIALQLLADEEVNPGLLKAGTVLKDLESGEKQSIQQAVASADQYFSEQENWFREEGIPLERLMLSELPHQAVTRYLQKELQR